MAEDVSTREQEASLVDAQHRWHLTRSAAELSKLPLPDSTAVGLEQSLPNGYR